jgi:hypothetical protein
VYKLKKAFMGLSRPLEHGMSVSPLISWLRGSQGNKLIEPCLSGNKVLTNSSQKIYVDDIIFGATLDSLAHEFSEEMKQEFEMSMIGELNYLLGLQVKQTAEGIIISQSKYAKDLVKRVGLDGKSRARTPMSTSVKISIDLAGKSIDPSLYRSMIWILLYLIAIRPDIAFSVGVCTRFQANPKESHLTAVKRIIRYVNDTLLYGIWYSRETNLVVAGYSDADWPGNADDRKSTSGGCFYVGNNLVAWMSKKQASISLSTAEAKYIAAGSCCTQLLWMKTLLGDYGFSQDTMIINVTPQI